MERFGSIQDLERNRQSLLLDHDPRKLVVNVCVDTGCSALGAERVYESFKRELENRDLTGEIDLKPTGCPGFCQRGPVVVINPYDIFYQQVDDDDVPDIVDQTLLRFNILGRLLYPDSKTGRRYVYRGENPFYIKQKRLVMRDNGLIDPTKVEDYFVRGGYEALAKVLTAMDPEEVIDTVEKSGLRGRGGAGFPTGTKWRFCRRNPGEHRYIICNADEGDPGAFMDRTVLEGNPHLVLEGMIIGGYAMRATAGYIYARAEYPTAIRHLEIALDQCRRLGLLGKNILGSGFDFDIQIKVGAGAFVCGEETALMQSIEGKRGMPKLRPPFPAESGLWGYPTNINNVETWANIRTIISKGWEWYAGIGTESSKGTKVFSLSGRINNTGLVEVPMGITLREVVNDIGGGVPKGRQFKAAQMGGPSGGCIPSRFQDLPIDYESLKSVGSMMGSGGMIILDENTCMVDLTRFFLAFTQSESCGECFPCRLGTKQLLSILTRITQGRGRPGDIEKLVDIGTTVKESSLCGLGQSCANPVLSTINYFRDEYEAHIKEHRCPAAACDAMVISACQHACPAGIDVPNYVAAIAEGEYIKAVDIIRERNPFPAVCGRICVHPCEMKCRRGELDEPVAIRALKRFASDRYYERISGRKKPFPVTRPERIAIVGAGPAGLTCAYFLRKMGYETTVFEGKDRAGGMLAVTIPEFRLPREIIAEDINYIVSCGVDIKYNSPIDRNHTVQDLLKDGFSSVFIAAGAQAARSIGIPGEEEEPEGLMYGLDFLGRVKQNQPIDVGHRVLVIGGGNVAMDVARTARRVGGQSIHVVCLEKRDEMPAWIKDIEEAEAEGVVIETSWGPKQVLMKDNKVSGVEFIRCLSVFDLEGRFRPSYDENDKIAFDCDTLIIAIGQAPDLGFLSEEEGLERAMWGTLQVDDNTLATNVPGIFAGGDFTTGPTFVIRAVASGRRAAIAVDKYLAGDSSRVVILDEKTALGAEETLLSQEEADVPETGRVNLPQAEVRERVKDFREVEAGYTETQAREEARRCLRCDLEGK
ncbi:MAG: NADH-quinone oxidoreductase subunit NuoF [Thermodesulfobacteriota bacterium]|nr:NADH-quinone oxidoreductase subunit NuoF [Thermodesulfobacteriota bacterium]